jgi:hypothetical protein
MADNDHNTPEMIDARLAALRFLIIEILQRNPEMIDEIRAKIDAIHGIPNPATPKEGEPRMGRWSSQKLVMQGILTRAKYPDGPPEPPGGWPED